MRIPAALASFLFRVDDVADCAAGDQLPDAFMYVINKKFGDEFDATNDDSSRDVACYDPSNESRRGGS